MPATRPTDDSEQDLGGLTHELARSDEWEDSHAGLHEQLGQGLLLGLGGVVRGLTVLVWALPLALAIVVWTAARVASAMPSPFSDLLMSMGVVPAVAVTIALWFGVWQLGRFQPNIPSWQRSAERARGLALLLIGFAPFLFWWSRRPELLYFKISAAVLILLGLFFLAQLNAVLRRLTGILPDQALREETVSMARLNYFILGVLGVLQIAFFVFDRTNIEVITTWLPRLYLEFVRLLLLLFMVIPVAITIALMWKIKETILESVFSGDHR